MARLILGRLLLIPILLLVVNFAAFSYAHAALPVVAGEFNTLYGSIPGLAVQVPEPSPLLDDYLAYLRKAMRLDLGTLDRGRGPLLDVVVRAATASLGLLGLTYLLSTTCGVVLGLLAVKREPPGPAGWILPFSSVGLALPSFFIGSTAMGIMLLMIYHGIGQNPFPFSGFGWDRHLVLPTLTLMLRPTLQIAQFTSRLLGDELNRQYVISARAFGASWQRVRWRTALRPVLAPLLIGISGALRLTLGELMIVETLFAWNGLGALLLAELSALNAVPLATYLTLFTLAFLLIDLVASAVAYGSDPRLRIQAAAGANG